MCKCYKGDLPLSSWISGSSGNEDAKSLDAITAASTREESAPKSMERKLNTNPVGMDIHISAM